MTKTPSEKCKTVGKRLRDKAEIVKMQADTCKELGWPHMAAAKTKVAEFLLDMAEEVETLASEIGSK